MKQYRRIMSLICIVLVVFLCMINITILQGKNLDISTQYKIDLNRVKHEISAFEENQNRPPRSLNELMQFSGGKAFSSIDNIEVIDRQKFCYDEIARLTLREYDNYMFYMTSDHCYKITYHIVYHKEYRSIWIVNTIFLLLSITILCILFYIKEKILQPFHQLSQLPYELSKGNLTVPLKENRNRFFGRFLWGMDLLREKLEENKKNELKLMKEKKLLLLSLSHDIKTPLSAIKLYSKALSKNLYHEENRKIQVANNISDKVDEIENYISEIVKASSEEFLNFEVTNQEFYTKDVLEKVKEYYLDKMELNQIDFNIENYSNCIVYGDPDRLNQVIQNIIENAIKYGDGRKIWLKMDRDEEFFRITIRNTGCELEKEQLPHIFDSFYRGSNVQKNPGNGLGLYICRNLMHLMEGEILATIYEHENERIMSVMIAVKYP